MGVGTGTGMGMGIAAGGASGGLGMSNRPSAAAPANVPTSLQDRLSLNRTSSSPDTASLMVGSGGLADMVVGRDLAPRHFFRPAKFKNRKGMNTGGICTRKVGVLGIGALGSNSRGYQCELCGIRSHELCRENADIVFPCRGRLVEGFAAGGLLGDPTRGGKAGKQRLSEAKAAAPGGGAGVGGTGGGQAAGARGQGGRENICGVLGVRVVKATFRSDKIEYDAYVRLSLVNDLPATNADGSPRTPSDPLCTFTKYRNVSPRFDQDFAFCVSNPLASLRVDVVNNRDNSIIGCVVLNVQHIIEQQYQQSQRAGSFALPPWTPETWYVMLQPKFWKGAESGGGGKKGGRTRLDMLPADRLERELQQRGGGASSGKAQTGKMETGMLCLRLRFEEDIRSLFFVNPRPIPITAFSFDVFKRNVQRATTLINQIEGIGRSYGDVMQWKSPAFTFLTWVVFSNLSLFGNIEYCFFLFYLSMVAGIVLAYLRRRDGRTKRAAAATAAEGGLREEEQRHGGRC